MIKSKMSYVTNDGKEFDTCEDAENHVENCILECFAKILRKSGFPIPIGMTGYSLEAEKTAALALYNARGDIKSALSLEV